MLACRHGLLGGVSKNAVIGHRYRGGWKPRKETPREPSTVFTRCDAWNAFMDRVLEETRPFVEDRRKVLTSADDLDSSVFDRSPGNRATVGGTEG